MAASCYLCANGVCKAIGGVGNVDPLGACQNCSIFACSGHAHFDSGYPRWICVSCDTTLLTGAGIAISGAAMKDLALTLHFPETMIEQGSRYRSVNEFLQLRPSYGQLMAGWQCVFEIAWDRLRNEQSCEFWDCLSDDGKKLVAAAIHIVNRLNIPDNQLVEMLRCLIRVWRKE